MIFFYNFEYTDVLLILFVLIMTNFRLWYGKIFIDQPARVQSRC